MPTVDDLWASIGEPLAELKAEFTADPAVPWTELRQSFLTELGQDVGQSPAIQQFLQQLDAMTDVDRNSILASDRLESLAYSLVEQNASGDESADDGPAYDEQAWQDYLTENGPQWDGTDEGWDQFREWFSYYAAEQQLAEPASELLDYLETQSAADRITTFASYGVTITPPQWGSADLPSYDEEAWQALLAENGPAWDGTDETWQEFCDWFAYYAEQQGLAGPATELLGYLSAQPVAQRIGTFAEYGVTISLAADAVGPELSTEAGELSQQADSVLVTDEAAGATADEDEDEEPVGEKLEQELRALFGIPPDEPIVIVS
jgi:hypothetical protein